MRSTKHLGWAAFLSVGVAFAMLSVSACSDDDTTAPNPSSQTDSSASSDGTLADNAHPSQDVVSVDTNPGDTNKPPPKDTGTADVTDSGSPSDTGTDTATSSDAADASDSG